VIGGLRNASTGDFMSRNTSRLLAAAAAAAVVLGTSTRAEAVLIAYICDDIACTGGGDTIVTDQGPGDTFPGSAMLGQINSGALSVGGFTIVTNVTQSKPLIGSASAPQMDISFSAATTDNLSHTVFLYASDTGFTGAGPVSLTLGGTQTPGGDGNMVQGRAWGGTSNNNLDFSLANLLANSGLLSATPFAVAAGGNLAPGVNPYSLTIGMTITRGTAGSTTGDLNVAVSAVPEPETYALMVAGLGALGFVARRRKRS
jgi:hypothetical protein